MPLPADCWNPEKVPAAYFREMNRSIKINRASHTIFIKRIWLFLFEVFFGPE